MSEPTSSKAFLTALNIIYFSLVMVMTLFGAVVVYLHSAGMVIPNEDVQFLIALRYTVLILVPIGVGSGYYIYKKLLSSIESKATLREKLFKFQNAILIRSACLEFPGLFGCVAAMISGDQTFLLYTAIIVVLFVLWRPTVTAISDDMGLSMDERSILEDPQGKI